MIARMSVFLQFMSDGRCTRRLFQWQRELAASEPVENPAQSAQCFRVEAERERLRNFWRDTDHLFAAQQPFTAPEIKSSAA